MRKKQRRKLHNVLPTWIGMLMGVALWSVLASAASSAGGRYKSPAVEVPALDKAPAVLKIQGRDDDVHVYPSDRFEIKYRFYLNDVRDISPEKAADIFSKFEVRYKNGVLTSKVPSSSAGYSGVGVLYEIGLPPKTGLEANLVDGDVVIDRVVLSALKIHGVDGDISLNNTQILGALDVHLEDGDVTLNHATLNGKIVLQDGDVLINASRDNIGEVETKVSGDGEVEYHASGCAVNAGNLSCTNGKGKLKISVADGDVALRGN